MILSISGENKLKFSFIRPFQRIYPQRNKLQFEFYPYVHNPCPRAYTFTLAMRELTWFIASLIAYRMDDVISEVTVCFASL
jgi:hypothetical protein